MTDLMQMSAPGIAKLEHDEGVVLKAYRCPAGRWTIGCGLTSASGVIKVKPGMTLTPKDASRYLKKALNRNYEPRVRKAMPNARQHEFDAGVSFDFNTGAIHKASWVKFWDRGNWIETKRRMMMWVKGGGRVLPGLVRRRAGEFKLLRYGRYGQIAPAKKEPGMARVIVGLDRAELREVCTALTKLGYEPGGGVLGIRESAVRQFQRDHDLTVDGIIGRATLSTLQRRLDAPGKAAAPPAVAASGAGAGAVSGGGDLSSIQAELIWLVVGLAAVWFLWVGWQYRDVIAVKVQSRLPSLAKFLRRI